MTSTQLSFSAFAATQTDPGNFAVSDQSGQRGGFFPSCPYPLPKFFPVVTHFTGDNKPFSSELSPGFYNFQCGCLDAPLYLASGGVSSFKNSGSVYGTSQAYRHCAGF